MRYRFSGFSLDVERYTLQRAGEPLQLRPKPLDLLILLVERAPEVVSKEELLEALWPGTNVGENSLAQCVSQLRRVLGEASGEEATIVRTVHGRGYGLGVPVSAVADETPPAIQKDRRWRLPSALGAAVVLVGLIALARPAPVPAPPPPQLPPMHAPSHVLAVLPFDDLSPGDDQGHLAGGLTEEITHATARAPGLAVVARTSAAALHRQGLDARAIGERLEVGSLVEGSVRREGERVRVTVQLIDAASGRHRWSRTWDRTTDDLLEVQAEIAAEVARSLERDLGLPASTGLEARSAPSFAAYDLYLRGWAARRRGTEAGVREAIEHFGAVIALEPDYAPAHAALAGSLHNLWVNFSAEPYDGPLLARAEAASRRAVELDPADAWAQHARASVLQSKHRDWEAAERALRRAVELDPGHSHPHRGLGVLLMRTGHLEEARASLYRALRIDPLSPGLNLLMGRVHFFLGEHETAVAFLRRSLELSPERAEVPGQLALVYRSMGEPGGAQEALLLWSPPLLRPGVRVLGRLLGPDRTLAVLQAVSRRRSGDTCGTNASVAAAVYAQLGDADRLFVCLGREVRNRHPWYLKVNPVFDPYRDDPRFPPLLHIAGLDGPL